MVILRTSGTELILRTSGTELIVGIVVQMRTMKYRKQNRPAAEKTIRADINLTTFC